MAGQRPIIRKMAIYDYPARHSHAGDANCATVSPGPRGNGAEHIGHMPLLGRRAEGLPVTDWFIRRRPNAVARSVTRSKPFACP
jgi:hypothetical protein